MTQSPPRPPALARTLARRAAGRVRRELVDDLDQIFAEKATTNYSGARRWYWRQALGTVLHALRRPARASCLPPHPSPRGSSTHMNALFRDFVLAVRNVVRSPGHAAIVVLTLAFGIGANTAAFSIVRTVLLRPLPFAEADRLVVIWKDYPPRGIRGYNAGPHDVSDYQEVDAFVAVAGWRSKFNMFLRSGDGFDELSASMATQNLLDLLGVEPLHGAGFDSVPGGFLAIDPENRRPPPNNAMVSYDFFVQRLGADPNAVGTTLEIRSRPTNVIGVLPPDFGIRLGSTAGDFTDIDIWYTGYFDPTWFNSYGMRALGKLREGVSLTQAQAEMDGVMQRQYELYLPYAAAGAEIRLVPLFEEMTAEYSPLLWAFFAAVGLLLLIVCLNVSSLQILAAYGRTRDASIRSALGARRSDLVRQFLVESVVLATLGAAVGIGLAYGTVHLIARFDPADVPRLAAAAVDPQALMFCAVLTLVVAVATGLIPALRGSSPRRVGAVRALSLTTTADSEQVRARNLLVAVQVALSFVLFVATGQAVQNFVALQTVDPGFEADALISFRPRLDFRRYPNAEARNAQFSAIRQQLLATPGVVAAGGSTHVFLNANAQPIAYGTEAEAADGDESDFKMAFQRAVTPGYFEATGAVLLEGRLLDANDEASAAEVAVVDEYLAATNWPDGSAVGQRLFTKMLGGFVEIVGVVRHQNQVALGSEPRRETIYKPSSYYGFGNRHWFVRGEGSAVDTLQNVRTVMREFDPDSPLTDVTIWTDAVAAGRVPARFSTALLASFSTAGLIVALVGIFGLLASQIRSRRSEIGIRRALGAPTGSVLRLVTVSTVTWVGAGLAIGVGLSFATSGVSAAYFPAAAIDAVSYVGLVILFLAVAGVAAVVPMRRAASVAPIEIMRSE